MKSNFLKSRGKAKIYLSSVCSNKAPEIIMQASLTTLVTVETGMMSMSKISSRKDLHREGKVKISHILVTEKVKEVSYSHSKCSHQDHLPFEEMMDPSNSLKLKGESSEANHKPLEKHFPF